MPTEAAPRSQPSGHPEGDCLTFAMRSGAIFGLSREPSHSAGTAFVRKLKGSSPWSLLSTCVGQAGA